LTPAIENADVSRGWVLQKPANLRGCRREGLVVVSRWSVDVRVEKIYGPPVGKAVAPIGAGFSQIALG
jgi:hypothetical protein